MLILVTWPTLALESDAMETESSFRHIAQSDRVLFLMKYYAISIDGIEATRILPDLLSAMKAVSKLATLISGSYKKSVGFDCISRKKGYLNIR